MKDVKAIVFAVLAGCSVLGAARAEQPVNPWIARILGDKPVEFTVYGRKLLNATFVATSKAKPSMKSASSEPARAFNDSPPVLSHSTTLTQHMLSHEHMKPLEDWIKWNHLEANECLELIHEGRRVEARGRLEQDLLSYRSPIYAEPLFDLVLDMGGWKQALALGKSYLEASQPPNIDFMSDRLLLEIFISGAICGETYEGEREFMLKRLVWASDSSDLPMLPVGDSAADLECLACLNLSNLLYSTKGEYARAAMYSSMAYRLQPNCPAVCFQEAQILASVGQYSKAYAIVDHALRYASASPQYKTMLQVIRTSLIRGYWEKGDRNPPSFYNGDLAEKAQHWPKP